MESYVVAIKKTRTAPKIHCVNSNQNLCRARSIIECLYKAPMFNPCQVVGLLLLDIAVDIAFDRQSGVGDQCSSGLAHLPDNDEVD